MTLRREDLAGTWMLERFTVRFEDGREVFPMGSDARGMLIYGADGTMSATLSRANREPLPTSTLEAYTRAPIGDKATAFDGYLGYVGRFRVDGDDVIHEVEMASVPNIVGASQRRRITLNGTMLMLDYTVESSRGPRRNVLQWRRR